MKTSIYLLMSVMLMACGGTKNFSEQEDRAYQNLKELVASRHFEIISNWANPAATVAFTQVANSNILGPGNTANSINILGTANYLRVKGDTIVAELPFYGEQNFGGSLSSQHQGIEFDGVPRNLKVKENDNKHSVEMSFNIEDEYRGNENYQVFITLFPNNNSSIRVQSTNRSAIEFTGTVRPWEEDTKTK